MELYAYGMKLRGFSIGCQPMRNWERRIDDISGRYYDIVLYTERLTEREVANYELEYLGTLAEWEEKMRKVY